LEERNGFVLFTFAPRD